MYSVLLTPSAQRDLRKLSGVIQDRVLKALGKLEANPRRRSARKLAAFDYQWRARVGEYRVLYEIDDEKGTVFVYRVIHRREAYR